MTPFYFSNKLSWIVKFYIKRVMRLLPTTFLILILFATADSDSLAPYDIGLDKEIKENLFWVPFVGNFMVKSNTVSLI